MNDDCKEKIKPKLLAMVPLSYPKVHFTNNFFYFFLFYR
jgi:hypothetical protein